MPQLITVDKKMFRINMAENRLEISYTNGILWVWRSRMGPRYGRLKDLLWFHNQLFALTDKGIWRSRNEGADWGRCGSGRIVESLVALQDGGQYLYGLSTDGHLYYSYNEGANWARKS
jgi:hypothetical protein